MARFIISDYIRGKDGHWAFYLSVMRVAAFGRFSQKLHQSRPAIWRLMLDYHCTQLGEGVLYNMPKGKNTHTQHFIH